MPFEVGDAQSLVIAKVQRLVFRQLADLGIGPCFVILRKVICLALVAGRGLRLGSINGLEGIEIVLDVRLRGRYSSDRDAGTWREVQRSVFVFQDAHVTWMVPLKGLMSHCRRSATRPRICRSVTWLRSASARTFSSSRLTTSSDMAIACAPAVRRPRTRRGLARRRRGRQGGRGRGAALLAPVPGPGARDSPGDTPAGSPVLARALSLPPCSRSSHIPCLLIYLSLSLFSSIVCQCWPSYGENH